MGNLLSAIHGIDHPPFLPTAIPGGGAIRFVSGATGRRRAGRADQDQKNKIAKKMPSQRENHHGLLDVEDGEDGMLVAEMPVER